MRDAHRMKDKLDLSLDSRQIVSLLIAGMVVLGAVFVLGVVVGKKLSEGERAGPPADVLAQLDEKAREMKKVSEEPPLTFQSALTQKEPPAAPAAPAAPVKASPPERPPEAAVAVAVVPPAPAPAAPPEPEPEAEVEPEAPPAAPEPPRARTAKLPPAMPSRPPQTGFTLQLSASQSREEADRFAAMMRDRGYAPYIVAAEVPGRGTWHRVRMGSFPTKEAAQAYLADFKRETRLDAFVAPAK
jgi:cell division septation protein DedD